MTPQFIMRCGLADYKACLLDDAGNYVPKSGLKPAPAWDTLAFRLSEAQSEIDNLDWFESYYDGNKPRPKGILTADWNHVSHRTELLLERAGYELEWQDTTTLCDDCNLLVPTEMAHYGDYEHYWVTQDGEVLCNKCTEKNHADEYLDALLDNDGVGEFEIDPTEYGFVYLDPAYDVPEAHDNVKSLRFYGFKDLLIHRHRDGTGNRFAVYYKPDSSRPVEAAIKYLPDATFDSFDIFAAYYEYASLYHAGQGSKEYALFGALDRVGYPHRTHSSKLNDNAKAIYTRLVMTGGSRVRDRRDVA